MQAPFTQLICDRCGSDGSAGPEDAPRFTFCPSCRFFVCAACWVPERGVCRGCAQPGLPPAGGLKRAILATLMPEHRLQPIIPRKATGFEEARRNAILRAARVDPKSEPQPSRARRVLERALSVATADLGFRLAVAVILALAIATLVWMLHLSPSNRGAASSLAAVATPSAEQQVQAVHPSAPAPSPNAAPTFYLVRSGDTLRSIARQLYADETAWEAIYAANRAAIANPDSLVVGTRLTIPPAH